MCNAVSNSATVTFDTAINSGISTGDEVVGTGNTTNPTVSAIAENRLSITLSAGCYNYWRNNIVLRWFSRPK